MGDKPIGFLIKELREKAGLSQRKLAIAAGVDRGYLNKLESGKNFSITLGMAERLAKPLKIPPSALLDMLTIEDYDIQAFMVNDFPELDDEEKDWLKRTIQMVRERKNERQKYEAEGEVIDC